MAIEGAARIGRTFGAFHSVQLLQGASADYATFLLAVIGIGGTLLGLYYTALSIVVSTSYAHVAADVRALFVRERAGNLYTSSVGVLVVASLVVVSASYCGVLVSNLLVVVLGLVSIYVFLALLFLGPRAFEFFDPAALSEVVHHDFIKWTRRATSTGPRSQDPSFQQHYGKNAASVLETLRRLVSLVEDRRSSDLAGLGVVGQRIVATWAIYSRHKAEIPASSLWFERTYEHPDWLTAGGFELDRAIRTYIPLLPKERGDNMWVEKRLEGILDTVVKKLVSEGQWSSLVGISKDANQAVELLARRFQHEEAVTLARSIVRAWQPVLASEQVVDHEERLFLGALELFSILPGGLLEGLMNAAQSMPDERLRAVVLGAVRSEFSDSFGDVPARLRTRLAFLRAGIQFERRVEGASISPEWWLLHECAREYLRSIDEALEGALDFSESVLLGAGKELQKISAVASAVVVTRGLATTAAMEIQCDIIEAATQSIAARKVYQDPEWQGIGFERHKKKVGALRVALVDILADIAGSLAALQRREWQPDFFGQAHTILTQECFLALVEGQADRFKRMFSATFRSSLAAHERLRMSVQEMANPGHADLLYMSEPLVDILEVSGYALLFAKLDGSDVWRACLEIWEKYLAALGDRATAAVEFICRLLGVREEGLLGLSRGSLRFGRKRAFHELLAARGIRTDTDMLAGSRRRRTEHSDPLIRMVARDGLWSDHAEFIFIVEYLGKKPGATNLPPQCTMLKEELERERSEGAADG